MGGITLGRTWAGIRMGMRVTAAEPPAQLGGRPLAGRRDVAENVRSLLND